MTHRLPRSFSAAVAGVACIVLGCSMAWATPPVDYYQTITSQTGVALKTELNAIVSGQRGYTVKTYSYDAARDMLLSSVDNVGGGQVRMLYTNDTRPTSQWAISINREHTWPQSFGAGASPKVSDMHHLFLCDDGINSSRGNDLYGNVTGGTASPNFTGLPQDQNYYKNGVWQVSPRHRGDVARGILYMDTRYSDFSLISRGQELGSKQMGYLDDLLLWNNEDPVDSFEQQRNERVFAFQNNRNPYIDNNAWVALVYGGSGGSDPILTNLVRTPTNPDAAQAVSVSVSATDSDGIASVQLSWRVGTTGGFTTINMPLASGTTYTTATTIPAHTEGTLIQYFATATDTLSNSSTIPISGAAGPDSFTVRGNNPVLTNLLSDPSTITSITPVNIIADVIDDDGNTAPNLTVTAFWRIAGQGSYTAIPMSLSAGTTWQTTTMIPAQPTDTIVEYYVQATDSSSASATIPPTGNITPASYLVEELAPFVQVPNAPFVAGKLLITEFAHSVNSLATTEFVEIVNTSDQGFILDNVMIADNNVGATSESYIKFPTGSTIDPGGIIVVFNRAAPDQAFIDTIPVVSNRNNAAVQVFVVDGGRTFNGTAVPAMVHGDAAEPSFSNGDNVELVYIDPTDGDSEEIYHTDDVIDGVGWGTISTANTTVGWGPNVTTTTNADNVTLTGGVDGATRNDPADTDTKADWTPYPSGANPYTPGFLPPSFEIPKPDILLSGAGFSGGVLTIAEGGSATLNVSLTSNPGHTVNVSIARTGGSDRAADFQVVSGSVLTFTTANFATPQAITIQKLTDVNAVVDTADFSLTGADVEDGTFTAQETENSAGLSSMWILLGDE
ncbi:endonuclease [Candidatus Sumerlaeota bacterium]|nr:endonuclease [Candidatus Sumerlaeota bacterium]